ncbi:hypothetical protein C5D34_07600 [Rathayibacter sp. AY1B1]|uniref:hypothetical protein n=1 Tax=unclassified Rathayibacter TaxID=2609250 RepID=UPI000CE92F19|nr:MULTISPECIES: hypothetical protein [unclassified Rathayibacter]PPI21181.1 hypothetical protein C5D08_08760 [Rathayibacter sp. AY1B6]PPI35073.1 hypothetical protein C5D34_07600 [Rathayibacter sp. AY1B1]
MTAEPRSGTRARVRRTGLRAAPVALAVLLPMAGCAPAGALVDERLDISAYSEVHAVLDRTNELMTYPIDAYFIDAEGLGRIVQANALLRDDCMREGGRTDPSAAYDLTRSAVVTETTFGIWSPERAARSGYGFDTPPAAAVEAASAAVLEAAAADPGWEDAMSACEDRVETLPGLGRDYAADEGMEITQLPQAITNDAGRLASADPRWDQARARCGECLVAHGLQLRTDSEQPWSPQVPDDPEAAIRTAVQDVQCKEDTRLVETLSSLQAQYQAALIDGHRAELDEVAKKERAVLERADAVIARHGR